MLCKCLGGFTAKRSFRETELLAKPLPERPLLYKHWSHFLQPQPAGATLSCCGFANLTSLMPTQR